MSTVQEMPPRGHYLAAEVGRLAGVSGQMIGQWSNRKLIRASQRESPYPKIYAFQDIAEAIVVHELIEAGATRKTIRKTIADLRATYGSDWPLSTAQLAVGGGKTYDVSDGLPTEIVKWSGAQPLSPAFLLYVGNVLSRGGWASRDLPDLQHVEVNPSRLSGRPTIRGRRVSAEDVAITAITGGEEGIETLHEGYDLNDAQIGDAVRWWKQVRTYEEERAEAV